MGNAKDFAWMIAHRGGIDRTLDYLDFAHEEFDLPDHIRSCWTKLITLHAQYYTQRKEMMDYLGLRK